MFSFNAATKLCKETAVENCLRGRLILPVSLANFLFISGIRNTGRKCAFLGPVVLATLALLTLSAATVYENSFEEYLGKNLSYELISLDPIIYFRVIQSLSTLCYEC